MQIGDNEEKDIRMHEILQYYGSLRTPFSQETIVEMLREIQDAYGCISPPVCEMAAETAGIRLSMVRAILKRYPSLKTVPYTHEIVLCTGRSCASKGSLEILRELKERLRIGKDGMSEDGRICLKTRNCLKQCRTSPNVMVDGQVCCVRDVESILRILADSKKR